MKLLSVLTLISGFALAQPIPKVPSDIGITSVKLKPTASANLPACNMSMQGRVQFDVTLGALTYCDGGTWLYTASGQSTQYIAEDSSYRTRGQFTVHQSGGVASTSFLTVGQTSLSSLGSLANAQTVNDTVTGTDERTYIGFTTAASNNSAAGLNIFTFGYWGPSQLRMTSFVRSAASITAATFWHGFATAALTTLDVETSATASATSFAAVGAEVADSVNFYCCSGNGTNYSCQAMSGTLWAVNTVYEITVDTSPLAQGYITCSVNGVAQNKTTHLPPVSNITNAVGPYIAISTNEAVAKTFYWSRTEGDYR